jgi:hypothetical protein
MPGVAVEAVIFKSSIGGSLERNRARVSGRVVPDKGVAAKYHKLQLPTYEEGFDALYYVTMSDGGAFIVQAWNSGDEGMQG